MLYETRARIYNKRMPIAQDCVKFRGLPAYCMAEISCKQLCWFPGCSTGKKSFVQSLVVFGISNISYCVMMVALL